MPGTWVQATGLDRCGSAPWVSDNPYRLPHTVVPSCYRLVLEPDLDGASFAGTVSLDVTAPQGAQAAAPHADPRRSLVRRPRVDRRERPTGSPVGGAERRRIGHHVCPRCRFGGRVPP